jgi:hypothetical protein
MIQEAINRCVVVGGGTAFCSVCVREKERENVYMCVCGRGVRQGISGIVCAADPYSHPFDTHTGRCASCKKKSPRAYHT